MLVYNTTKLLHNVNTHKKCKNLSMFPPLLKNQLGLVLKLRLWRKNITLLYDIHN
jgi:hypothetical protein